MAITIPVADQEISASTFGAPVAQQVNSNSAFRRVQIAAQTVAAGTNADIFTATYTVPATLAALVGMVTIGYSATGVGDLTQDGNQARASIPAASGGCITVAMIFPRVGTTVTIKVGVYAWGGAAITLDGTKSSITFMSMASQVTGNIWP